MTVIVLDKDLIGAEEHVVRTINDDHEERWLVTTSTSTSGTLRADELCHVIGEDPSHLATIPTSQSVINKTILNGLQGRLPNGLLMRKDVYERWISEIIQRTTKIINSTHPQTRNYMKTSFQEGQFIIDSLERPNININLINASSFSGKAQTLASLDRKISYERFSTRTGRLTIKDGARVLTMPRVIRKSAFVPTSSEHSLVSFDFVSLDPRVALTLANSSIAKKYDIYAEIAPLIKTTERSATKKMTMSAMYGSYTIDRLSDELARQETCRRLRESVFSSSRGSYVLNAFGRPTFPALVDDDGKLFGAYIQSTSTDATLIGFSRGMKALREKNIFARPIYILHDELVVEMLSKEVNDVANVFVEAAENVGLNTRLRLKHEIIS